MQGAMDFSYLGPLPKTQRRSKSTCYTSTYTPQRTYFQRQRTYCKAISELPYLENIKPAFELLVPQRTYFIPKMYIYNLHRGI
jgi:hypothetical protein